MKKKRDLTSVLLVFILLTGLTLLLYPTVAEWWNSSHQTKLISNYVDQVSAMNDDIYDEILRSASAFNSSIKQRRNPFYLSDEEKDKYESLLNIGGTGIMGYIEIPEIDVSLAIYHGTSDGVLQVAAGHLEWTSLPVGGENTHCVISAHRGLPSAKLFTNLDRMTVGDTFMLKILDETLTYEVDQILIVEPADTEPLKIVEGYDYCTLETCTPYGINSHRLLVRGHRVENAEIKPNLHVTADATRIDPLVVAPVLIIPVTLVVLLVFLLKPKRGRGYGRIQNEVMI